MDGLMFDTERIGHRGWKYGAQVLGLDEVIAAGRGMSVADSRAMYLERLGPEVDYDALRALRVAYADEAIARDGLPVKPGLRQLLEHLRAAGIPAALATATVREKALLYLKMAGVDGFLRRRGGTCKTGTGYLFGGSKGTGRTRRGVSGAGGQPQRTAGGKGCGL